MQLPLGKSDFQVVLLSWEQYGLFTHEIHLLYLGLDVTKPVFGVSDIARLKPVSLATQTI